MSGPIDLADLKRQHAKALIRVKEAIRASGHDAQTEAKRSIKANSKFKDRTGKLRSTSGGGPILMRRGGALIKITAPKPYASFVEEGTKPHVIRARRAKFLRFVAGGQTVFVKSVQHPGTKGTLFLRDATNAAFLTMGIELRQRLQRAVERV
jgi:hypothetical protein